MDSENKTPSETLEIQIGENNHTLLMTYGLLTRLSLVNQSIDDLVNGGVDPVAREAVLVTCLKKHGRSGVFEGDFDIEELDISISQCEAIFDWAMGHLLDFFMRRMEAGAKISAPYRDRLQALTSSITGSEA